MNDPNITMEEYIRLEEEKARKQGRTFNWQTATYGKMKYYENEDDSFTNLKTEYPAIVFEDTSDAAFSREPTGVLDTSQYGVSSVDMSPLLHHDLRHPWLRYQVKGYDGGIVHSYEQRLETIWGRAVNRVHMLDFAGLTDGMRQTLSDRLSMIYIGDDRHALFTSHTWRRLFEVRGLLVREFTLEFFSTCRMSDTEMGLDVADTLSQYLFRHAEKRKSRASELPLIDLHELVRLNICLRVGDTWAWVAPGPERQQATVAGSPGAAEDAPATDEGAQAVLAPVQAPQPPPPAPQHQNMSQRIERLEEEVRELRQSVVGLRGVVKSFITE
nr:hypothetical protein [Tanacetum cinerariifolium]